MRRIQLRSVISRGGISLGNIWPMTPEQRFTKIENFLGAVAEHQAKQVEEIQELRRMHRSLVVAVGKIAETLTEAQRATDEKLNALIDTVDRIVRRNGKDAF